MISSSKSVSVKTDFLLKIRFVLCLLLVFKKGAHFHLFSVSSYLLSSKMYRLWLKLVFSSKSVLVKTEVFNHEVHNSHVAYGLIYLQHTVLDFHLFSVSSYLLSAKNVHTMSNVTFSSISVSIKTDLSSKSVSVKNAVSQHNMQFIMQHMVL